MGKATRRLFGSAVLSGISLRLGLPGLADFIAAGWSATREPLAEVTPVSVISLVSFIMFLFIAWLTFDIYLKGARKGMKGLRVVVLGVICGIIAGSLVLASAQTLMAG